MEETELHRLDFYVQAFEKARQRVGDDAAAAAIVEQVGKDLRTQLMAAERANGRKAVLRNGAVPASGVGSSDRPSQKQLDWLRDLGVAVPQGISRQEASKLIDQATGRG